MSLEHEAKTRCAHATSHTTSVWPVRATCATCPCKYLHSSPHRCPICLPFTCLTHITVQGYEYVQCTRPYTCVYICLHPRPYTHSQCRRTPIPMHVRVHARTYMRAHTCVQIHVCAYMRIHTCTNMSLHMYIHMSIEIWCQIQTAHACSSTCLSTYQCIWQYKCLYTCLYTMCKCMYMCMHMLGPMSIRMPLNMRMHVCAHASTSVHPHIYTHCRYTCAYKYLRRHVCAFSFSLLCCRNSGARAEQTCRQTQLLSFRQTCADMRADMCAQTCV